MAGNPAGTYQDHYKDVFKDQILLASQQEGSVLDQTVMKETMDGNKTYFDKLGKVEHYNKTARGQDKSYSDITFERRFVVESMIAFDHILDKEDLIKYVSDPRNQIVTSATYEMGRDKDVVIAEAINGAVTVQANGSTSSVSLASAQKVAVSQHTYDSGSGDVELTTSKLKEAKVKITQQYGAPSGMRLFCVASSRQLMNLSTFTEVVSSDYRVNKPLEGPGVVSSLSGYLGYDFIEFEGTGVDTNADERAFVYTADAIKMGIYTPLTVSITRNTNKVAEPDQISVWEAIGATRMYEEKVVEIACNPISI